MEICLTPALCCGQRAAARSQRRRPGNDRDGSGPPLLLLVLTGILTFGLAFNNYVLLTEATSIGARTLAISRGATTDPCATASSAVIAAAPLLTPGNLSFTFVLNGTSYTGASCSSGSSTTGAAANLVQGSNVIVTVTYPCSLAVYGANYAPHCSLQAQMTELVQ
jgi:Flp pilus assembly protein TadG